ncbi:MAG TPA: hypothetical protein VGD50_04100 [Candidatus Baltobacteraceae bacterium]
MGCRPRQPQFDGVEALALAGAIAFADHHGSREAVALRVPS